MPFPTRPVICMIALISMTCSSMAQTAPTSLPAPSRTQLIFENDDVRVLRADVAEGTALTGDPKRDGVVIALPVAQPDTTPTAGEVKFIARGPAQPVKLSGPAHEVLIVELKQHWDPEIRPCAEPLTCVHKIRAGGTEIGETTTLFTNGFLTAYRHQLSPGGTLTSSYYSSKGSDRILLVPLTDLKASFSGIEEDLKYGQPYFSRASEVEVSAQEAEIRWVVIRIHTPKQP